MPNRIIKESIHTSEKVNAITDFQFRLWVSLITYVDDFGRGDARPAVIRGTCFSLRDSVTNRVIEAALSALVTVGLVVLYEVDGRPYLQLPNWGSHQTIRNKKSKFPPPDDTCLQLKSIESGCSRNPIQSESESNPNPKGAPSAPRTSARFSPPTVDEVDAYAKEQGYAGFNAEAFVAFYESKGWMVGKNPMKSWKGAVRGWHSRDKERASWQPSPAQLNPALNYSQRDYKDEDFDDLFNDFMKYPDDF